jgi:hypothetical protein
MDPGSRSLFSLGRDTILGAPSHSGELLPSLAQPLLLAQPLHKVA